MTQVASAQEVEGTRDPADEQPRPGKSWITAWFAVLMIITVGISVVAPTGWLGSDDSSYFSAAEHVLAGKTIHRAHHHFARMAVIVPTAVSIRLFGASPTTAALPSLVASVLGVIAVVILGRLLWGWWEGLCAGTVVAVLPFYRVISSTAYPDVQACFWATLAVLLAVAAARSQRRRLTLAMGIACGLSLGLGASATMLSSVTAVGVAATAWTLMSARPRRDRVIWLSSVALGGLALMLVDGFYHLAVADDFWFKLHRIQSARTISALYPPTGYWEASTFGELAWNRMTMLLHPDTSGFGKLGMLFWPVVCAVLLLNRRGRGMAVWAIATYFIVAFMPVSFRNGPQPFHTFHGREILVACVPFALCFAWLVHRAAALVFDRSLIRRGWPIVFAAVVGISCSDSSELSGFRIRPTQRVGVAIEQVIASTDWEDGREIFVPASLYLRYRILFPVELRSRLRVAVDADSPSWWRDASVDIVSRCKPLPEPGRAYLIATPSQMSGKPEAWDYGVGLPANELAAWQGISPALTIGVYRDKSIGPMKPDSPDARPLLILSTG